MSPGETPGSNVEKEKCVHETQVGVIKKCIGVGVHVEGRGKVPGVTLLMEVRQGC